MTNGNLWPDIRDILGRDPIVVDRTLPTGVAWVSDGRRYEVHFDRILMPKFTYYDVLLFAKNQQGPITCAQDIEDMYG